MWFLVWFWGAFHKDVIFTLLATFRGNSSNFAGLFIPKDTRFVMTTSLSNTNIPISCFCTVQKSFRAFLIELFTAYGKKGHHHFFDLMCTLLVDKNWSNRSTPLICLFVGNKAKWRISKRVFQENKARQIFRKTNISYPLIRTRTCVYQGVRNVCFSENLTCFVFLKHPFWDSLFCLITDVL